MVIEEVSYHNYRNIEEAKLELSPGTNVIWGKNAQGKTNLLEGIYFFARGKSFRALAERELVRFGEKAADIGVTFRREYGRRVENLTAHIPSSGRKRLARDGIVLSGTAEMIGELCAVLFAPSHLSLVSGAPGDRRSFLDIAIAQLLPPYVANLRRYNRVLEQRNALIRQAGQGLNVTDAEWESYAEVMADFGSYIAAARLDYISHLAPCVESILRDMTAGAEIPELYYKTHAVSREEGSLPPAESDPGSEDGPDDELFDAPGDDAEGAEGDGENAEIKARVGFDTKPLWGIRPDEAVRERLKSVLCDHIDRELKAGHTLFGVHKDDVVIKLRGLDARTYCSQGQCRSIALAMKLAEGEISRSANGEYPVFLLDDVLSELDSDRREYVLSSLEGRQIIVTSCEPDVFSSPFARLIRVEDGKIVSTRDQSE
jgi:DNA replication and repair protein RecF